MATVDMRFLAAAALAVLVALAAYAGGRAAGVWDPPPEGLAAPGLDGRRPKEDLNERDTASAKAAVMLAPTLQAPWREVDPTPDRGSRCETFRPDLSQFTITGKARSAMKTGTGSRIEFSVKIYADAEQASEVFRLTTGPRELRCIRDGVAEGLRSVGLTPRVVATDVLREPAVASETAIYVLRYELEHPETEVRQPYPVEVFVFRTGRAVGAAFFTFVADKADELRQARLVAARLRGV
jgi:hypothetical protein